uniref:Calcineurin-like phosphoesterase domain-containing protein n=1 Tax=viral metagenome TaxID=1070528 RepID=A0A6M3JTB8_9ZZZZ
MKKIDIDNFIIFSDAHLDKNEKMSIHDDEYITSWLRLQFKLISHIFRYAYKNGVKTLIFGGDLFELKDRIPQDLYNKAWVFFKEISKDFNLILNIGNHDSPTIYKTSESSGLLPFSEFATIIKEVTDIQTDNTFMRVIPYGLATGEAVTKPKTEKDCILILHEEIAGVTFGNTGYRAKRMDLPLAKLKGWNLILDGHIHKPQQMYDNIHFIGSLLPVDWGEAGDRKRFFHYNKGDLKSIPIPHQKFINLDLDFEEAKKIIQNDNYNFYRLLISSDKVSDAIFKRFNISYKLAKTETRRIRLKKDMLLIDEIKNYIKNNTTELNATSLLETASEIIK